MWLLPPGQSLVWAKTQFFWLSVVLTSLISLNKDKISQRYYSYMGAWIHRDLFTRHSDLWSLQLHQASWS